MGYKWCNKTHIPRVIIKKTKFIKNWHFLAPAYLEFTHLQEFALFPYYIPVYRAYTAYIAISSTLSVSQTSLSVILHGLHHPVICRIVIRSDNENMYSWVKKSPNSSCVNSLLVLTKWRNKFKVLSPSHPTLGRL